MPRAKATKGRRRSPSRRKHRAPRDDEAKKAESIAAVADYFEGSWRAGQGEATDRRLARDICVALIECFDVAIDRHPLHAQVLADVRAVAAPLRTREAAYTFAASLVTHYAELYRGKLRRGESSAKHHRLVAGYFIRALANRVDPRIAEWLDRDLSPVADLLGRFDSKPKGKRGKYGRASILAYVFRETRALGHTTARSLERVRKDIERAFAQAKKKNTKIVA